MTAATVAFILSDTSEVLLCWIFWHLSHKEESDLDASTDSNDVPQVAEFDEEADLMARIWNSFNRQERKDSELP
jgi:hypothetical protein